MTLKIADRVKETSTTAGTGTLNLAGAAIGFQTFVAGVGNGNTCFYAISHQTASEWEVGIGTVADASPDTLARTTVLQSSNSDNAVNFAAGTKDVFVTYPAGKAVYKDATGKVGIGTESPSYTLDVREARAGYDSWVQSSGVRVGPSGTVLLDADLSRSITVKAPDVVSTSFTLPLPSGIGSNGQVLTSDSKNTYWSTPTDTNTITALNNASANRLVTVGSTTTELDAESQLSFTQDYRFLYYSTTDNTPPRFELKHAFDDTTGSELRFTLDKGAAGLDNDVCGIISFYGDDENQENLSFAKIEGVVADASNGDECGALKLYVAENDGTNTVGLSLTGSTTDGEVDVTIGAGTASVVTIPGIVTAGGFTTTGLVTSSGVKVQRASASGVTINSQIAFGDYTLMLPSGNGTNGQVLTTDSKNTYWSTVSGGSSRSVSGDNDNGIITWVAGDDTFVSEANVTYDGSTFLVNDDLTVGVAGTGHDVIFYGDTSGKHAIWDQSEMELGLLGASKISFHDVGGGENIVASADGHLEINAGTTLDITAPAVDINVPIGVAGGKLNVDGLIEASGITVGASGVTVTGDLNVGEYLYHDGDSDTYIRFQTDSINMYAGNRSMIKLDEGSTDKVIINNGTQDVDLQVKGDTDSNLIRTDAANDRVGIGTSSPSYRLDVSGDVRASGVRVGGSGSGVLVKAQGTFGDYTLMLPSGNGTNGQVLTTDSKNTYWSTVSGGGGVDTTGTPANDQVAIFTDADTLEGDSDLQFDGTNLGIGVDPSYPLHIDVSNNDLIYARAADRDGNSRVRFVAGTADTANNMTLQLVSGTNANAYLYMGDTDDPDNGYIRYKSVGSANQMHFRTNAKDKMIIASDGRIGLGAGQGAAAATVGHLDVVAHSGCIMASGIRGCLETSTDQAVVNFDIASSTAHNVVLGGNRTLAVKNTRAGDRFMLRLTQDGAGNRTVTWFSTIKWAGGSAPTLTTTASKADVVGFLCTGTNAFDGFVIGQNI